MINVFKKRTRLYALTTSTFFFLQGVDSSVGSDWFSSFLSPSAITTSITNAIAEKIVSTALDSVQASISNKISEGMASISDGIASIPDAIVSAPGSMMTGLASVLETLEVLIEPTSEAKAPLPRAYVSIKQLPGSRIPLFALFPKKGTYMCEESSDDSERGSVICVDGEEHTIKGGKIRVREYGDNAVFAVGRLVIDNADGSRSGTVTRGASSSSSSPARAGSTGSPASPGSTARAARAASTVTNPSVSSVGGGSSRVVGVANSSHSGAGKGPFVKTVDIAKATSVKVENVSIVGVEPKSFNAQAAVMGFGSAVFSLAGAKVELVKSNIENFAVGLEAGYRGNIRMKGGSIKKTFVGATASFASSIFLEGTDINVEVVNEEVPLDVVGLRSSGRSQIAMKSGSITFARGGVGVLAEDEGFVKLDDVKINIADKKGNEATLSEEIPSNDAAASSAATSDTAASSAATSSVLDPSVVFLLEDGFVSSNRVTFNGSDAIALWVNNDSGIQDDLVGVINYFSDGSRIHDSFLEFVDHIVANGDFNIRAAVNHSTITVNGKGSYGIYFGESELEEGSLETNEDQNEEDQDSSVRVRRSSPVAESTVGAVEDQESFLEDDRSHMVLLRHSVLKVPDSVAIYGEDLRGVVVLGKDTIVSGDLLLRATGSSILSVYAHGSNIIGSARVDGNASADLLLSFSEWHLTKSQYSNESSDTNCMDSCVSSIDLRDSTIAFLRSEGEDRGYQTLRVGDGSGTVYVASGDSYIHFNARLVPNDSESDQMSDRLLIHGDVFGKTIVRVKDTSEGTPQDQNKSHSISIIQVFGQAGEDSFKLEGDYITRKGSPYKYILRAYGPTISSSEMRPFDKQLIENSENENSRNVWDFRLENQYVVPRVSSTVTNAREGENGDLVMSSVPGGSGAVVSSPSVSLGGISVTSEPSISNIVHGKPAPIRSAAASRTTEVSGKPSGSVLILDRLGDGGVSSQCNNIQNNGEESNAMEQAPYACRDGQTHIIKNFTLQANDKDQHSMHAQNENTIIKLENATIMGRGDNESNIDLTKLLAVSTVLAEDSAEVVLEKNSTIQSSLIGLETQRGGKVTMNTGTVNARYVGALAGPESSIILKDATINVTGDLATAGLVSQAGQITMNSGTIVLEKGVAVRSESGGRITLDKVSITAKKGQGKLDAADNFGSAAFLLSDNSSIDFRNGSITADASALWIMDGDGMVEANSTRRRRSPEVRPTMNRANIESSTVKVGGQGTYGIYFDGRTQKGESKQNRSEDLEASVERSAQGNTAERTSVVKQNAVPKHEKSLIHMIGEVSLKQTNFEVAKGIAIYGNNSGGHVSLANKTTLAGDLLLKAENNSNISVSIDNSIVKGGVRVNKDSYAKLDLINGSEWILKRSTQKDLGASDSRCVDSCVSSVRLVNSAIDFASPESGEKYQTLHIGNGKGTVYEVQGDVVIHLNARLNPHDSSSQQITDRLVIHGDVSGKTKIHVRGDAGNVGNGQKNAKIAHSVSVIQVYGQAKKDSFQLDGNYVALRNSPYKYTLRSYGPEATSEQKHVQQKFVKDGGAFWNFRLENQYVKSAGSAALSERLVRSVVPQVPTYLVLPNSVFHTGLMDINNQNKQLETLRMTSTGMVEVRENPALYLRGYGGSYRYASDLSALEYGYDGDLDYRGVEAGVLLKTIENTDSALSFGVMGTYGKLSLKPLDVEQSQKSAFDKWTATVYGSMQHNVGFYVDGLLSYGLFKGDVLTLARGKTATLKGNPLNVSLIGGQTIATGYKGFVFDPQVQVVYQHLQFNKARDIDNFDIEMGNLDQWVARVGGRLTKNPTGSEGVNAVAFYGKLYLAHGFGEKQSVHFSDSFKLGAFGSSLEAGVGFNAKLLPQFSLHADILYQHKLNKAGFSGAGFSGGVRYQF
ncbi:autotransporter outer membrane beta-barrel domain-containing protein [Bartonella krasnovii]|uniref:autotransporter outer membrane beta-barrel domain-containing protein n=1 Tax=Bartonella krasnovii TaxID=2267275 RepID=UPI001F4CE35B|nr:autotransporter outer membrane beta-barrel domain-containing protein [Bartonella krasnovii]UNF35078.1 autotransporter outer membrane beta-barrel domain-containing protein [Bartonella krasnovii]UNF36708.1 autotransporter outer membrane beta-barrel domain-containing protein [Bartonella krasnovii]UNF48251.1 autotransporter outer membrane beta-barrel domain-containing protein [Bartonella krasnovii]